MEGTDVTHEATKSETTTPTIISFPPSSSSGMGDEHEHANDEESDEHHDDSEEEEGDEDQVGSFVPSSYRAPQLGLLSLPSPTFGASVADLFAPLSLSTSSSSPRTPTPTPGSRPPSRIRSSSNVSRNTLYSSSSNREPTLNFGKARESADRRKRREGKAEECWVAEFPEVTMELSTEDPGEWLEEEWNELGEFLKVRGYQIDEVAAKSMRRVSAALRNATARPISSLFAVEESHLIIQLNYIQDHVSCHRISDSLPLHLTLVPIDDISYELDVLEHLSQAGICSNAHAQSVISNVPLVGLVPLNEDWTAILMERWIEVNLKEVAKKGGEEILKFVKDVVGAVSFLHSQHITHLAISPLSILSSSSQPTRYSLTSFSASHQSDPLSKRRPMVSNPPPPNLPVEYLAPERLEKDKKYDPFKADLWALGKVLQGVDSKKIPGLDGIVKSLMNSTPAERPSATEVFGRVKKLG